MRPLVTKGLAARADANDLAATPAEAIANPFGETFGGSSSYDLYRHATARRPPRKAPPVNPPPRAKAAHVF